MKFDSAPLFGRISWIVIAGQRDKDILKITFGRRKVGNRQTGLMDLAQNRAEMRFAGTIADL